MWTTVLGSSKGFARLNPTGIAASSCFSDTPKMRARKSVEDMADQLLALYAQRKTTPGFTFSPDSNFQREFEDALEFEETADQMTAISDIKRDMERGQPMDRLLCGDVGYGK